MTNYAPSPSGILGRGLVWSTVGSFALVFLSAFETLAVTTVMPVVSAELGGAALYALAFAGPMATSVVGMVAAGTWSDRSGPTGPLYAAVATFVAGLFVCGFAGGMETLVLGRLVQGLGGGAVTVALYVLVARLYPPVLHARIFAAFAAAWVIPSLIGPFAAGIVADTIGWRWVFLGVVVLVAAATLMVRPALAALPRPAAGRAGAVAGAGGPGAEHLRAGAGRRLAAARLAWSCVAAVAVLGLDRLGAVPLTGPFMAVAAAAVALWAVRPLVPRGTLVAARGLPSVVLVRGLVSAGFMGAEVYVPYLLTDNYGFPPALAGLGLTGSALTWAAASAVQGRLGDRLPHVVAMRVGAATVAASIAVVLAASAAHLPGAVVVAGWTLAGAGMGLVYPRLSVMTLSLSTPANQGFNSSALSISDALGAALALAATGLAFAAFAPAGLPFPAVFALTLFCAALAFVLSGRVVGPAPRGAATSRSAS